MPTTAPSPTISPVLFILSLFDPRRWVGILFSILGVLASVIVPFLPTRITKLLSPSTTIVVPRRSHVRNASQASKTPFATSLKPALAHHSPRMVSTPVSKSSNRRHTSLNLTTRSRPLTQRHASYPSKVDSAPATSSGSTVKNDSNPYPIFCHPAELICNEPVASPKDLEPYSPGAGVKPRQSLDSLDLATSTTPPSLLLSASSRKVSFCISNLTNPELRSSSGCLPADDSLPSTAVTATNTATGFPEIVRHETDWHGNDTFAVKRPVILPPMAEALPVRRRPQSQNSGLTAQFRLADFPSTSASTLLLDLSPSRRDSDFPSSNVRCHSPDNNFIDTAASDQLVLPPERPMRTDPYKKFNIPAPGSERALAFLKAEKEWVKAEMERRKRENKPSSLTAKQAGGMVELDSESKKNKCSHRRRHSLPASRKSTETASRFSAAPLDGEDSQRIKLLVPQTSFMPDEFGVLPAPLSAVPEEDHSAAIDDRDPLDSPLDSPHASTPQQRLSQGKRLWVFSKRPKSQDGVAKEKRKEDTIEKKPGRPKSRDSKIKVPRINLMGVKDGGYVSDTAVTSLTYQLIS